MDKHLFETGVSDSIEKAKKEILSGWVKVNGETIRSSTKNIVGNEEIKVERPGGTFVSRGGEKLKKALDTFKIDLDGCSAVDFGSSTGGFTDCMLKRGASSVVSIDVGYGQLDYSLRTDSRVDVRERTNVRDLVAADFNEKIDFVSADLSFISIRKVFNVIEELFSPVDGVFLLKPQFEAESDEHVKGVVRVKENHIEIITRVLNDLLEKKVSICGLTYSPIKGPAGNIEFLVYYKLGGIVKCNNILTSDKILPEIKKVVEEAHNKLN